MDLDEPPTLREDLYLGPIPYWASLPTIIGPEDVTPTTAQACFFLLPTIYQQASPKPMLTR
jgi:hypothetical protein